MTSTYGRCRTDELLEGVANRSNGVLQRSGDVDSESTATRQGPDLPDGFWARYITDEIKIPYSRRKQKQLSKSLTYYVLRIQAGSSTPSAMRAMRRPGSSRGNGGSLNARKAAGLDFALLQFFVDCVQRLSLRSDTNMLMEQARAMRDHLILVDNIPLRCFPKLTGSAGTNWFSRWRKRYGIAKKTIGMKLKVLWEK